MAAILQLKRGDTTPTTLLESEPFFNMDESRLEIGDGSQVIVISKMNEQNKGSFVVENGITSTTLNVSGDSQLNTLSATGLANLSNTEINGTLKTTGNSEFTGSFDILGNTSIIGQLSVEGISNFIGNMSIIGDVDNSGSIETLGLRVDVQDDTEFIALGDEVEFDFDELVFSGSFEVQGPTILDGTVDVLGIGDLTNFSSSVYGDFQNVDNSITTLSGSVHNDFNDIDQTILNVSSSLDSTKLNISDYEIDSGSFDIRIEEAGIFKQTGSFYATTNDLEITGSIKNSGSIETLGAVIDTQDDTEFLALGSEIEFDFDELNFEGAFSVSGSSTFDGTVDVLGIGDLVNFSASIDSNKLNISDYEIDSGSFDIRIEEAGIFKQTGSFYATTNDLEITGSIKNSGSIETLGMKVDTQEDTELEILGTELEFDFDALDFAGAFSVSGSTSLEGPFNVSGSTSLEGPFNVIGDSLLTGDLEVTGNVTGSNLNVNDWNIAFAERGSQIDGSGLTWNVGTGDLDVDATVVRTIGTQTIGGIKTFTSTIMTSQFSGTAFRMMSTITGIGDGNSIDWYDSEPTVGVGARIRGYGITDRQHQLRFFTGMINTEVDTEALRLDIDQSAIFFGDVTANIVNGSISNGVHGDLSGGSLHAIATPSTAGFMSAADKDKLDGIDGSGIFTDTGTYQNTENHIGISGSLGVGMAPSLTNGRIDAADDIVAFSTSDIRLKTEIEPITNPNEKLDQIRGVTFTWNDDKKEVHGYEGKDVGVIAQEIEKVLPELVTTRGNGYKAVKYEKIVALLIEAVKEQSDQIAKLHKRIDELSK